MFVISPITSFLPLLPSSHQHMFPCSSALFFPILRFSSPCHRVCFLNSSFWAPPPSAPPALLLFTPATHLSQSIRPRSGHPAITLHYRHIQHTNFTQRSTWGVPLLCSYWSKQNSPRPLLVATPRGLATDSEMIIFYNVTYLCWKWLHPMVFWGMRPPFGAGNRCIQWAYYTIGPLHTKAGPPAVRLKPQQVWSRTGITKLGKTWTVRGTFE